MPEITEYAGKKYLTTTCLVHFLYEDNADGIHHLHEVTMAAIPNGRLQEKYNSNTGDGIWLAGRNAPSSGEDFRVRISFNKLMEKALWGVQKLRYDLISKECVGAWQS